MYKRDYKIIISADVNDEVYWQMFRKGEPAACNEEEEKLVEEMLSGVFHKLKTNTFLKTIMTQEEKAKAYDEAIKRAKALYDNHQPISGNNVIIDNIFPELGESEDERVRESLLEYLHTLPNHYSHSGVCAPEWIAWLEKQGEQMSEDENAPKFKVGDWITNGDYTWKIVEVEPLDYVLQSQNGNIVGDTISHVDEHFHSFTIKDAKPGDVIYVPNCNNEYYFFIFKGIENAAVMSFASFYQYDDGTSKVEGTIDNLCSVNDIFHPAIKEQCDFLFKKMKEAGYEWNAEKKELKRFKLKFKPGEWVATNFNNHYFTQITSVEDIGYETNNPEGFILFKDEKDFHIWTIQDAKDGDVLQLGEVTAIFQKYIGNGNCKCYCSIYNGEFEIPCQDGDDNIYGCNAIPATKEQRDLLFQKMKDSGYKWDSEKKELKMLEPNFNVGDWVVENGVNRNPVQITSFEEDKGSGIKVWFSNGTGTYIEFLKGYHKWTIQDAKDGDVLASELCDSIILFKGIKDDNIDFYCDYDFSKIDIPGDRFAINNGQHYGNVKDSKDFHPATKEQRDLLFSKMKEAGYMLDEETHMLKKIETRPILSDFFKAEYERGKADAISEVQKEWTEDDKNHIANILNMLLMEAKNAKIEQYKSCVESDIDWICSLKNKIHVQPKQEWSEDDKKMVDRIRNIIEAYAFSQSAVDFNGNLYEKKFTDVDIWLKSLKERIQLLKNDND